MGAHRRIWGLALACLGCAELEELQPPDAVPPGRPMSPVVGEADAFRRPLDRGPGEPRRLDAAPDAGSAQDAGAADAGPGDAAPADRGPPADQAPPPPDMACDPETCDGTDEDCDGRIDEGPVCGPYVAQRCTLWLGWADERRGPPGAAIQWGPCPRVPRGGTDDVRCTSTRGQGNFALLDLAGDVNDDDQLGVALTCADNAHPELAGWFQQHCALFLGWADRNRGGDGRAAWGACPDAPQGGGELRCTSTGFDGHYRAMNLDGDVDDNDDLAVAWICRDDADPARAEAASGAVQVFLGWADRDRGPADGSPTWGPCPGQAAHNQGDVRCVSTGGDQQFHKLDLGGDVNGDDQLSVALRPR